MTTDRHRQLAFACDPAGGVLLEGARVRVTCEACGQPMEWTFAIARIFGTGNLSVFDRGGKQRHVRHGRFRAVEGERA